MGGKSLIVADTHVLVWLTSGDSRLGRRAQRLLDVSISEDSLAVSAITFWEVALLVARGRLDISSSVAAWRNEVLNLGVIEVPVDGGIAVLSVGLTGLHPDPGDRIVVATAMQTGAALMTADERLLDWKNRLRRHDARR